MIIVWYVFSILVLAIAPVFTAISLSNLSQIQRSEVFEGVTNIEFILNEGYGDETIANLIPTIEGLDNYGKSFLRKPICNDVVSGRNWLFVDVAEESEFLENISREVFGECRWLFSRSTANLQRLRKIKPAYNSNVFLWQPNEANVAMISEIYSPSSASRVFEHDIAGYRNGQLTFRSHLRPWERRSDLDGVMIVATSLSDDISISNDSKAKLSFGAQIVRDWSRELNFTFRLMRPRSGGFGLRDKNGTWNGMMHQLITGEADLCLAMTSTKQRAKMVDFLTPFATTWMVLVSRKTDLYSHISFLNMLDERVWIVGGVTVIVFSLLAVFIQGCHRESYEGYGSFTVYRGLVNQAEHNGHEVSKTLSWRILVLTVLLFGYLGTNFIAANLVSSISVLRDQSDINTLEDVESYGLELFLNGGTFMLQSFASAKKGTTMHRLWDKYVGKDAKYREVDSQILIRNFLQSKTGALILIESVFDNWVSKNKIVGCELRKVRLQEGEILASFVARKNFPYFRTFNELMRRRIETGVNKKDLSDTSVPSADFTCKTKQDGVQDLDSLGIGFDGTKYFFWILTTAVILSLFLAVLELGLFRFKVHHWRA